CPGSPLSPWGSASWVSFRLGCPVRPCGFYRAQRGPRTMGSPYYGKVLCLGPSPTHQLQLRSDLKL
ncbi:hypothetical protein LDENG_00038600, partial [Lucifuga dentata]